MSLNFLSTEIFPAPKPNVGHQRGGNMRKKVYGSRLSIVMLFLGKRSKNENKIPLVRGKLPSSDVSSINVVYTPASTLNVGEKVFPQISVRDFSLNRLILCDSVSWLPKYTQSIELEAFSPNSVSRGRTNTGSVCKQNASYQQPRFVILLTNELENCFSAFACQVS